MHDQRDGLVVDSIGVNAVTTNQGEGGGVADETRREAAHETETGHCLQAKTGEQDVAFKEDVHGDQRRQRTGGHLRVEDHIVRGEAKDGATVARGRFVICDVVQLHFDCPTAKDGVKEGATRRTQRAERHGGGGGTGAHTSAVRWEAARCVPRQLYACRYIWRMQSTKHD